MADYFKNHCLSKKMHLKKIFVIIIIVKFFQSYIENRSYILYLNSVKPYHKSSRERILETRIMIITWCFKALYKNFVHTFFDTSSVLNRLWLLLWRKCCFKRLLSIFIVRSLDSPRYLNYATVSMKLLKFFATTL